VLTDRDRRELFEALEQGLGHRPAELLMELLPPVGWGDVATQTELRSLGAELRGEMARLEGKIDAQLPKLIAANAGMAIAVAGLVLAAARLA
jgi:hypothetical protein